MSKVVVSLASGNSIEKPLLTCFKGTLGDYLIFDNEANGSMGYPIIGVTKYNNGALEKITDPAEWGQVKENLKNIISGNKMEYIKAEDMLTAPDDFFTQLTLPVPSFDILKNSYAPAEIAVPAPEMAPVMPSIPEVAAEPAMPSVPEPMAIFTSPLPEVAPEDTAMAAEPIAPIAPVIPEPPVIPAEPEIPEVPVFTAPIMPEPPVVPEEVTSVESPLPPMPEVEKNVDFSEIKAEFMAACENVFDALIKKMK